MTNKSPPFAEMSDELPFKQFLAESIRALCQETSPHKRTRYWNHVFRKIYQQPIFWFYKKDFIPPLSEEDYEDGIFKALKDLHQNLCAPNPNRRKKKDKDGNEIPRKSYLEVGDEALAYLLKVLRTRLIDSLRQQEREQSYISSDDPEQLERLPNPILDPIDRMISRYRELLEADPSGELSQIFMRRYPLVTAQKVLLMRLDGYSFAEIATSVGLPNKDSLQNSRDGFYHKKCKSLEQKYAGMAKSEVVDLGGCDD
jgi:hypothetical protein